jgi:secreted Zn-dependent insulinase-like peptidase
VFEVEFTLTDKGMDNYQFVIQAFQTWIKYVKNIYSSPGVWEIMQKISEYDFYFMHQDSFGSDSASFASRIHKFPFRYLYTADRVFFKKDDAIVNKVLNQITFNNTFVVLTSPKFADANDTLFTKFDRVDQYYGTEYKVSEYSPKENYKINQPETNNGRMFNQRTLDFIDLQNFNIPSSNRYIPFNLDIICPDRWFIVRMNPNYFDECSSEAFEADGTNIEAKLLHSDKKGELWYKLDRSFFVPLAKINIRLDTDKGNTDLVEEAKLYFFEALLAEWIMNNLYDALQMSYQMAFSATHNGIELNVFGYSDKIIELTKIVLESFRNLKMEQKGFDRIKSKFITDLQADKMARPYVLAFKYTKSLYHENFYSFDDILKIGQTLELKDVQDFHTHLFDKVFTKTLIHGNIAQSEAKDAKEKFDAILNFGPLENPAQVSPKMHILSKPHIFVYHLFNSNEDDCAIMNTYQAVYLRKNNLQDLKDLLFLEISNV